MNRPFCIVFLTVLASVFFAESVSPQSNSQDLTPEWESEIERHLKARETISPDLAWKWIELVERDPQTPNDLCNRIQAIFFFKVWKPANDDALAVGDAGAGEASIRNSVAGIEKRLIETGASRQFAQSGRYLVANYFFQKGMYAQARNALDDERLVEAAYSNKVTPLLRGFYFHLAGHLAIRESNFADAHEYFSRALHFRKRAVWFDLHDLAETYHELAVLAIKLGDFAQARLFADQSVEFVSNKQPIRNRQLSPLELRARISRASAIEYSQAAADFETAIEMLKTLAEKSKEMADRQMEFRDDYQKISSLCRNNLAIIYIGAGNFEAAEQLMTAVIDDRLKNGEESILIAESRINLAWAKMAQGKQAEAERLFRNAMTSLLDHAPHSHRVAEARSYLARAIIDSNPDESRALLETAMDDREKYLIDTLATSLSQRNRIAFIQNLRLHPESIAWPGEFDTYLELAPDLGISDDEIYRRVLTWKGALARSNQTAHSSTTESVARLEGNRNALRRELGVVSGDETQVFVVEQKIDELEREIRRLSSQNRGKSNPILTKDIQLSIPSGAALLDIVEFRKFVKRGEGKIYDERMYRAFIVTAEKISWINMGLAEDIDPAIIELRDRLGKKQDVQPSLKDLNDSFGSQLFSELSGIKTLIICPDGKFHGVPWAALMHPTQPGKSWIDTFKIVVIPFAQSLVSKNSKSEIEIGNWVTVGGVDYGPGNETTWEVLKNTGKEVDLVDEILSKAFPEVQNQTRLRGKTATRQAMVDVLAQRNIVHVATHGQFRGDVVTDNSFAVRGLASQMDSALIFAGANDDPTGGLKTTLTAEEIQGMDLSNIRLLVLSACETALGHVQAGQGVVGLTDSFQSAGVDSIVASLMTVDDEATGILMTYFYKQLLANRENWSVAQAFREAQIRMRQHDRYRHPHYWAPWVVIGIQSR